MSRFCHIFRWSGVAIGILCLCVSAFAADRYPQVNFVALPADMLPSNEIRKLYQDSDGYIWIPTYNGLARYDGYGVVTYGMRDVANGLFNTFVNVVAEDRAKNLWIGTEHGLFRLDKIRGEIVANEYPELLDCNISVILCDSVEGVWIGSNKGLFRKEVSGTHFHRVALFHADGRPVEAITSVVADRHGRLWVAAFDQGLLCYDIATERVRPFDDPVLRRAHVVACDSSGRIWVGTWGAGLVRLVDSEARDAVRYVHYRHQTGDPRSLLDDIIYAIEEDPEQQTLWVGGRSGLSILHDAEDPHSFQNFRPGDNRGDLPYNEVNSILRSRDGLMWIGMLGGGVCKSQTSGTKFEADRLERIRTRYNTSSIRSMYYAGEGRYWFGLLDFGLLHYDARSGSVVDYHEHPDLKKLPYTSTVNAILRRATTGELCFGTQNAGIWLYDEARHRVRVLNRYVTARFFDDCVIALCEDRQGNLWIGSREGVYVETAEGTFHTIAEWTGHATPFDRIQVFDICCDPKGDVWIASNGQGILCVEGATRRCRHYAAGRGMTSDYVYCLESDDSGCIWAGTVADGLAVRIPSEDGFRKVTVFPNLENRGVSNIARGDDGRMWLTTSNSVFSFLPDRGGNPEHINTYVISTDMPSYFFNRNTSAQIDGGRIAFGGSNGLMIFTGARTPSDQIRLPIVLTDFKIHNRSLRTFSAQDRSRICDKDINYAERVTLTHDQNNFLIEFSMLSYANSRDHIFRYRLEGNDEEYISVDSHHRFASYNNLPSGRYLFRLQAAGDNGVWSSNERLLEIRILPAPWLSWWAWTLYVMLFTGAIYGAVRFLHYRFRLQQEVQLSKLEQQKIEELNHAKLQFFTNVTHELMTPLTIILTSLQNLTAGTGDQATLYGVMTANATRLMRLIQQILEFRKVESGNLKIRVSQGDIVSLVRRCVEAFAPLVARKRLNVYFHTSADRIEGWFDPDKLDKIVYNLLSNAAKYTPEGGEISIRIESETPDRVRVSVINSGDPMSPQTIEGLFKRFYDGSYRKFHTVGTGIGLSLVKDLTDIHKGTIRVTSSEAAGNCFRVTLPVGRDAYSEEEIDDNFTDAGSEGALLADSGILDSTVSSLPADPEDPDAGTADHTLLVVDDNEELLLLMSNLLSPRYRVETASDGEAALRVLAGKPVDLVISDIMMPGMNGIELCRKIKNTFEYCHIPVILLTAKSADEDRIEGYDSGADGYLTKPFNLQLLHAQIANQLRKLELRGSRFRDQPVFEVEKLEYTSMDEKFMRRAVACVNAHIDDCAFTQSDFTREMNMSRTVLTEKLKSLTGLTPSAFVVDLRLRAAYHLLETQQKIRIADLAYAAGFNDPKYFSTCFRRKFGVSPKELIARLHEKGDRIV